MSDETEHCYWDVDMMGIWHASCGTCYEFINDGPKENGVNFCHKCGRPVCLDAIERGTGGER